MASIELLNELHDALKLQLLEKIKAGEATASDLNVARQFLKDNGINCDGPSDPACKSLVDSLPTDWDQEAHQ